MGKIGITLIGLSFLVLSLVLALKEIVIAIYHTDENYINLNVLTYTWPLMITITIGIVCIILERFKS